MDHHLHSPAAQFSTRMCWFMLVAWVLILVKCAVLWWAINHWRIPIASAWLIVPTLGFAALATLLWFVRGDE